MDNDGKITIYSRCGKILTMWVIPLEDKEEHEAAATALVRNLTFSIGSMKDFDGELYRARVREAIGKSKFANGSGWVVTDRPNYDSKVISLHEQIVDLTKKLAATIIERDNALARLGKDEGGMTDANYKK